MHCEIEQLTTGTWQDGLVETAEGGSTPAGVDDTVVKLTDELTVAIQRLARLEGAFTDEDKATLVKLAAILEGSRLKIARGEFDPKRIADDHEVAVSPRVDLAGPQSLDGEQALHFASRCSPADVAALSISSLKILLNALFSLATGVAKDKAINKLIQHADSTTVRRLVRHEGFTVDDFDGEVNGKEWNQLVETFEADGVMVPYWM